MRVTILATCLCAAFVTVRAAEAAVARLDTGGFESYTLGSLTPDVNPGTPTLGQQGWIANDQFAGTTNVASATIQTAVKHSGSQALQVDRAPWINNRWAVVFGPYPYALPENQATLPSSRFILIDWDMRVEDSEGNGAVNEFGPFFGVEAYDFTSPSASFPTLGSLGVDASTGQVVHQATGTGAITNSGANVNFGDWNHFAILLDFAQDQYSIFLNGTRLNAFTFVDNPNVTGGLSHFTDADISAVSIFNNAASNAIAGTAYFDNFRVLDGIPADFDNDGDVDAADLGQWRTAYGINAVGDADGDGDSDGNDLMIWQRNVGVDLTPAVPAGAAVPEPAGAALVAMMIAALAAPVRRRA
jgi:hypothetical protein